jgi:DNA-binding NtrC family response regulator
MATILIVEEDSLIAFGLQRQLTRLGHTVLPPVASAEDGLAAVQAQHPEVVFVDVYLSETLDRLRAGQLIEAAGIPVIYLSPYSRASLAAANGGTAPLFHLEKPFTEEAVARTLAWAVRYGALQRALQTITDVAYESRQQMVMLHARAKELHQQLGELREALERWHSEEAQDPPTS